MTDFAPDSFPCTKCGLCCVAAGKLGLMPQREDGACVHLGEDNLCTIYETRPDVCRLDRVAEKLGASRRKTYEFNAAMCNAMQEKQGLDSSFRVDLSSVGGA